MAKLDFSSQAEPAAAPSSAALDFSASAEPVREVGAGESALRGLVRGGGALLNTLDRVGSAFDPGRVVDEALAQRAAAQQGGAPAAKAVAESMHPLAGLASQAADYGATAPNEVMGKPAQFAGGVTEAVPQLAAAIATGGETALPELLPAGVKTMPVLGKAISAILHGAPTAATLTTEQATNLPDTLSAADKVKATAEAAGINTLLAGVPGAFGTNPLLRTGTGAALGYGTSAAQQALQGQPQDSTQNLVGAFLGAMLGGAHPGEPAMDPHLQRYVDSAPEPPAAQAAPLGLPRGADFSARAEPVRPQAPDVGGPVHVDARGTAATPEQAIRAFTEALATQPPTAPGLPEPVVQVDRAGNALTTADLHAQAQPREPVDDLAAALGLTPDVLRAQARDPRMARELPPEAPRALPAPTVTVDKAGKAMTSADYLKAVQQAQAAAEERKTLGLTDDVERAQAARFRAPESAASEAAAQAPPSFSFAGERAHTADRGALAQAQQMEAMGRDSVPDRYGNQTGSPEDTHLATGWHRGADGKMRFEIDDSQATIKPDLQRHLDEVDRLQSQRGRLIYPEDGHRPTPEEVRAASRLDQQATNLQMGLSLGDVLDHPPLMAAYPHLADVAVRVDRGLGNSWGAYNPSTNTIEIRKPSDYPEAGARSLKSVLLHEVQHAIQSHEGFARGGSSTEFARPRMAERDQFEAQIQTLNEAMSKASAEGDKPTYDRLMRERRDVVRQLHEKGLASDIDIQDRAHRDYHRLAGEVEARNTQARLGMSAEERRATPPTETADVPRADQIVRVNSAPGERRAISHDDTQAIARYNERLTDYLGKAIRLAPAPDVPDAARRALAAFDAAFGSRSIVVRNETPDVLDFNGVTLRDGVRMLNEDATAPLLTVAGHELIHQLRKDAPDLYDELATEIRRQGRLDAYGAVLQERAVASGENNALHPEAIAEELTADAAGDAITDPEFMERLAQRNPGLFRRLADHLMRFLASVTRKLRSLGSSPFLEDVEAFRAKLADVLERYAERKTGAATAHDEPPPGPMFSRKPAGDEFAHLEDMPSRRPGESQADYARRVTRKNGEEIREGLALAKQQREIGRLGMRAMWAKQDRAIAIADHAFAQYRKLFDKEDPAVNLRTIDQWENGQPIGDYDARQFFGLMKEAFDQRTAKIQALAPDAMQQLIDNYFPHIWEDTSRALKWYQGLSAKRPLQGDRSFLKQRVHATIKDGMATGLKPVSTNPVDLAILKLGQMDKFIAFHEFRQDLQQRGWLRKMEAGERVPVGYARVEDPAFQIAGGLQGYYAVPELIARDINNYLSPSLYRFGAWKALRTVQNVLMSSRLGLSMFHGGFTTMDNLVMHADVAGRRLMQGDLAGGLGTLLKTPLSIVWSPFEGGRLNKEWLGLKPSDRHTAAVLDMLEQGGAHMKMSATDYNNAIPKLVRAFRQKSASGALKQALPALGESISWVIHHQLVPNQKMAARVMLAKFELDRVAGALGKSRGDYAGIIDALHPDALKQLSAHVVNLVDDRLGQMNYDNQFWNKTAREVAQAAIGAVGWQVGTLRTVTGGVRDLVHLWKPEKLLSTLDKAGNIEGDLGRVSGRLTYLLTLALLMGGLSAVTQYLMTGKGPEELKDYFFPKTGNRNDDGSDERLQWPSYWSDHYKLATHPLQTAVHKINPSIGMLMEALSNQDYFGTEIRNPDASWWTQAGEVGAYLAKGFVPYSLTGAEELKDESAGRQLANFFGITKAPASVSRSRFEAFVAQKAYGAMPQGARSQAQAQHAQAMHAAEAAIRRGQEPDMAGLTEADRRNVDKAARQEVPAIRFKRLGIEDKLRAYDLATPAERERYQLAQAILRSNWHKAVRDLPDDERDAVLARVQALMP